MVLWETLALGHNSTCSFPYASDSYDIFSILKFLSIAALSLLNQLHSNNEGGPSQMICHGTLHIRSPLGARLWAQPAYWDSMGFGWCTGYCHAEVLQSYLQDHKIISESCEIPCALQSLRWETTVIHKTLYNQHCVSLFCSQVAQSAR
jgi:hypothetical protein